MGISTQERWGKVITTMDKQNRYLQVAPTKDGFTSGYYMGINIFVRTGDRILFFDGDIPSEYIEELAKVMASETLFGVKHYCTIGKWAVIFYDNFVQVVWGIFIVSIISTIS